jgi:hypothetical protein
MTVAFQKLEVISRHRVRLTFSNVLAAGAFVTSFYAFESVDSLGVSPEVTEALIVPNYPNSVELTLEFPLVSGARYQLNLSAGVPATDLSTAASAVQPFPAPQPRKTAVGAIEETDAYVFQRDLKHNGRDYVEAPNGDLDTVTGPPNAMGAVTRRLLSNGLPWDSTYGAKARALVDAPTGAREELRHQLAAEAVQDDRVRAARVDSIDDSETGDMEPDVSVTLIDDSERHLGRRI